MINEILQDAKILIVDDEKANIRFLEIILQNAGFINIHSVADARQVLPFFSQLQPDLLLLDLIMPHLDGFTVMQLLQSQLRANPIPVLVLTADATSATKHKALQEGASDFLTKPLDEVEVLLRIRNLLEARFYNVLLENEVRERTQELTSSREQLRALAANLTMMREAERTEIAREVHDELGQALTGLKMDLAWLEKKISTLPHLSTLQSSVLQANVLQPKIDVMYGCIDTTIRAVQQIATRLRPGILDDLGLEAAIEWQAQEFQERTGIRCECVSSLGDMTLPREQSTVVFRILQESLTNIARHAAASCAYILLEENNGYLRLEVQDNGCGIDSSQACFGKSLGLLGMRERALLMGGEVKIAGVRKKGTTVTLCIPLNPEYS